MAATVEQILAKHGSDSTRLMDILTDIQASEGYISPEAIRDVAHAIGESIVDVEQTVSFYHFFSTRPVGKYAVYLNDSAVAHMKGYAAVAEAFEKQVGVSFGSVTDDGRIGLHITADIGMNDQEPAAIINGVVFTNLTPAKVGELVDGMRLGKSAQEMVTGYGDGNNGSELVRAMVRNNLRKPGPVIFADFNQGSAIEKCLTMSPEQVIEEIKVSSIRGRGGAGFPTGMKWEFCRRAKGEQRYVICNADEGEPGTFKDRVILTERPELTFEGMVVAGYAIGAGEGILYLRAEYQYLQTYLETLLESYRKRNLLGEQIGGREDFSFDIRIQVGAGAYICGEESALIESAEGKRGEPRNRPPFPVESGYLNRPTSVNNVESLCAAARVIMQGAQWFKAMGTDQSAGSKVLSISGDCDRPGIYEVPCGVRVSEIIDMCGARNPKAVQVGGPSGTCVAPEEYDRTICYGDLSTGGSIIMIGQQRDLLEIVSNFVDFFVNESCGSCVPCRVGNQILKSNLAKVRAGKAVQSDVDEMLEVGATMKCASRCGLGQTAANPVMTTIRNFPQEYESRLVKDDGFEPAFDLSAAVSESCAAAGRVPNLHPDCR